MTSLDFIDWLQEQINKKGWRPTDLAKRAHITDAAVSRIFKGERNADPSTLTAFAIALGIPPETIFRVAGILPQKVNGDEWVEKIDHKIKQIKSPTARRAIERMIDGFMNDEESEQTGQRKSKPRPAGT